MNRQIKIHGRLLARNSVINFIGQAMPLLVGVITIPFIVKGLGAERFGLLSLSWVVLGYFSLFDLGLGRATTRFVAEFLGQNQINRLPKLVWTSIVIQGFLGVLGGLLLTGLIHLLVHRILKIPSVLLMDARSTFLLLAASLPVVLILTSLRGILEAGQRFDLVNAVKIPSSSLTFLLPAVGVLLGLSLPKIVLLLLISKFFTALVYLILCLMTFPVLRKTFSFDSEVLRPLVTYGGWITVSSLVGPIMVYLDRFLIGSIISMAAVAYYTAPYEIVTRLWILPSSLVMTLFPAFSTLGETSKEVLSRLYTRSIKYLLLIMGPVILVLILFAEEILRLWLGTEFAERSTLVLQILAIGVLVNSLAQIPYTFLQGLGRPDITAKFHFLELLLYLPLAWFLVMNMGIAGGALAWTIRIVFDALLIFCASWRLYQIGPWGFAKNSLL